MKNTTCSFCRILETKSEPIIAENDYAFAIYDQTPATEGHTLIIPKDHIVSLFDCPSKTIQEMFNLMFAVKDKISKSHKPRGYTIGINEGEAAGRAIDHLHIHLIPRYEKGKGKGIRAIAKLLVDEEKK